MLHGLRHAAKRATRHDTPNTTNSIKSPQRTAMILKQMSCPIRIKQQDFPAEASVLHSKNSLDVISNI